MPYISFCPAGHVLVVPARCYEFGFGARNLPGTAHSSVGCLKLCGRSCTHPAKILMVLKRECGMNIGTITGACMGII